MSLVVHQHTESSRSVMKRDVCNGGMQYPDFKLLVKVPVFTETALIRTIAVSDTECE